MGLDRGKVFAAKARVGAAALEVGTFDSET
jgi:hypothetical protein